MHRDDVIAQLGYGGVYLRLIIAALPVEVSQPQNVALKLERIQTPARTKERQADPAPPARGGRGDRARQALIVERGVPLEYDPPYLTITGIAGQVLR